ncbi:hypothetical protein T01_11001 [Trichinella spiralis]|uniref:Uncharacterized protein n=1 Tax=Trichinella spiralis TaxID=6334 RepID=A0A0V1APD4_TRISP|nr:hypothetical protein T01_11001 [Trichinella spiralis]
MPKTSAPGSHSDQVSKLEYLPGSMTVAASCGGDTATNAVVARRSSSSTHSSNSRHPRVELTPVAHTEPDGRTTRPPTTPVVEH